MQLTIKPTSSVELDKRTNLPFVLSCPCPKCGETIEQDLSDDRYLSYPQVGAVDAEANPPEEPVDMYCVECDESVSFRVRIRVSMEVVI